MKQLYYILFDTPLGSMIACGDHEHLYMLHFYCDLSNTVAFWQKKLDAQLTQSSTPILERTHDEMIRYFDGDLTVFTIPIKQLGTSFQRSVWQTLQTVDYGTTASYRDLAYAIGKPTAFRAAANANRCNHHTIIVPCHRIIRANGDLCGYAGQVWRKKWLIEHERKKHA